MIDPIIVTDLIRVFLVFIIITAAYIISTRNLSSLVTVYAVQSLALIFIALLLFQIEGSTTLLAIAALTFTTKVLIIPHFIGTIQEKIRIKSDIQFHFLTPIKSLFLSVVLMLVVYITFVEIMDGASAPDDLFFFGAVIGISMMLMGMMIIFSRKRALTKVLGFLSMENGALLFGLFITELPFMIEFLVVIDLIILVLLTTILIVGLDSTIEDYHERLQRFHLWEDDLP
jgi:hydrogenase-4 component E